MPDSFKSGKLFVRHLALLVSICLYCSDSRAQLPDLPITVGDSGVGYIDSAAIQNQVRFRADATYGANKINRGEYIWAWPSAVSNGPPNVESNVDYQKFSAYFEYALFSNASAFFEAGVLSLNPEINQNTSGVGDIQAGFKYGIVQECDTLVTFQMKFYADNADAARGLGTGHFSVEPGLLFLHQTDYVVLEGELKHWASIDGTDPFEGSLIQYGLGASSSLEPWGLPEVRPVVELVGWTFVNGRADRINSNGFVEAEDAEGHTIINAKFGTRLNLTDGTDLYLGYGRSLTGQRFYQDIFRAELRLAF